MAERLKYLDIQLPMLNEGFLENLEEEKMNEIIDELNNIENRLRSDSNNLTQILEKIISVKGELINIIKEFISGTQRQINEFRKMLAELRVDSFTIGLFIENENRMNKLIIELKGILNEGKLLQAILKLKELCNIEKEIKKLVYEKFGEKYFIVYERITKYLYERNEPLRLFDVYEKILKDININVDDLMDALLKLDKIGIVKIIISKS